MPIHYQQCIKNLQGAYKKIFWLKPLFPRSVSKALNNINNDEISIEQAYTVYVSCLNNTWFFQRLLFGGLRTFISSDSYKTCYRLKKLNVLSGESALAIFATIARHRDPYVVADALEALNESDLLTGESAQANIKAIVGHVSPYGVARALQELNEAGLLTGESGQANREAIITGHALPSDIARALCALHTANLLIGESAKANRETIAGHKYPGCVARALQELNRAGILTGESAKATREAITGHDSPLCVASALRTLKRAGLLTGESVQANREAIAGHKSPRDVAQALQELNRAGLLTGESAQANREAIVRHASPSKVAEALQGLNRADLLPGELAQVYFEAIIGGYVFSSSVVQALGRLNRAGLLTGESAKANFEAIAGHKYQCDVAELIGILDWTDLLTGESGKANFEVITGHPSPSKIGWELRILNSAGLLPGELGQVYFDTIIGGHVFSYRVAQALGTLNRAGLLTGESAKANFQIITGHASPSKVAEALQRLNNAGLLPGELGQVYFEAIIAGHVFSSRVVQALQTLNRAGLLTGELAQVYFEAIIAGHVFSSDVVQALGTLNSTDLLTGESAKANFEAIAGHSSPGDVASALGMLNSAGLLTGESAKANRDTIAGHASPFDVALALNALNRAGLLTGESAKANRETIAGHTSPSSVAQALEKLNNAGLLTEESAQGIFTNYIIPNATVIFTRDLDPLWSRSSITQAHINEILQQPFREAVTQTTWHYLLSQPETFAYAEMRENEYSRWTYPFIEETILTFKARQLSAPDFFDLDEDEAQLCFYFMRNLIRRNKSSLLESIEYLLTIPSVKALAHQAFTQNELGNELLRLARRSDNRQAAALLLQIDAVQTLDQQNNQAQEEQHGLDLRPFAQNVESSMVNLNEADLHSLSALEKHYRPVIKKHGEEKLFQQFKDNLLTRYRSNPATIKTISGEEVRLPVDWNAFATLNLNRADYKAALHAYYQHPVHTALRWILKPNAWMSTTADYVMTGSTEHWPNYETADSKVRWSNYENHKPLMVLLWVAASDEKAMPVNEYDLDSRIEQFIAELAGINRAHNWDKPKRPKTDSHGQPLLDKLLQPIKEEFDDLEGDKPSCNSGVKSRLFQALQGHSLSRIIDKEFVKQAFNEYLRANIALKLKSLSYDELRAIEQACQSMLEGEFNDISAHQKCALECLNLQKEEIHSFVNMMHEKYGNALTHYEEYIKSQLQTEQKSSEPYNNYLFFKFFTLLYSLLNNALRNKREFMSIVDNPHGLFATQPEEIESAVRQENVAPQHGT